MGVLKPNFDRAGNEKVNLLWYILTLGTNSMTKAVVSALLIAATAAGGKTLMDKRTAKL
jgi:hypothetical protein